MTPNCPEAGGKHKSEEHKCFHSNCPWKGKNKASPALNEISPNTSLSSEPELPLMHIKGKMQPWSRVDGCLVTLIYQKKAEQKLTTALGLKWKGEALEASFCTADLALFEGSCHARPGPSGLDEWSQRRPTALTNPIMLQAHSYSTPTLPKIYYTNLQSTYSLQGTGENR